MFKKRCNCHGKLVNSSLQQVQEDNSRLLQEPLVIQTAWLECEFEA